MDEISRQYAKTPIVKRSNSSLRIQRKKASQPLKSPADRILFLQRTIGNQAVQQLIKSGTMQAKLKIGQPGDKYEQEADRVADAVMRMSEVQLQVDPEEEEPIQAKPFAGQITPLVQKQSEPVEEEEEEKQIQPKSNTDMTPQVTPGIAHDIHSFKGTGQLLPTSERAFFEPRFGRDFTNVRVHTNEQAARASQSINAQAFTLGRDIVFGSGQYLAGNERGNKLLAHELTHVVQQEASIHRSPAPVTGRPSTKRQPSKTPRRQSSSKKGTGILDYITGKIRLLGHEYELKKGKLYSQYSNIHVGKVRTSATSIPAGKLPANMGYFIWLRPGSMFRGMLIPFHAEGDLKKDAENGSTIDIATRWGPKRWHKSKIRWETIRRPKDYYKKAKKKGGKIVRIVTWRIDKKGGPRIEETLDRLYKILPRRPTTKPKLSKGEISEDEKQVIIAVAEAECGGYVGCVNAYDTAVISVGFKQVTLKYGSLQDTIKKATTAFKKHGIELDPNPKKKKYNFGKEKPVRIKGAPNPWSLRNPEWVLRFYAASMEDDVVKELVRRVIDSKKTIESEIKKESKNITATPLHKDTELIAILTQLRNNCPECYKRVVRNEEFLKNAATLIEATRKLNLKKITRKQYNKEEKSLEKSLGSKLKSAIVLSYKKGGAVGSGIWKTLRRYFRNIRRRSKIRIEARRLGKEVWRIFSIATDKSLSPRHPIMVSMRVQLLLKKETVMGVKRGVRKLVKAIDEFLATLKKQGFPSKTQLRDIRKRMNAVRALAKEMERW